MDTFGLGCIVFLQAAECQGLTEGKLQEVPSKELTELQSFFGEVTVERSRVPRRICNARDGQLARGPAFHLAPSREIPPWTMETQNGDRRKMHFLAFDHS